MFGMRRSFPRYPMEGWSVSASRGAWRSGWAWWGSSNPDGCTISSAELDFGNFLELFQLNYAIFQFVNVLQHCRNCVCSILDVLNDWWFSGV